MISPKCFSSLSSTTSACCPQCSHFSILFGMGRHVETCSTVAQGTLDAFDSFRRGGAQAALPGRRESDHDRHMGHMAVSFVNLRTNTWLAGAVCRSFVLPNLPSALQRFKMRVRPECNFHYRFSPSILLSCFFSHRFSPSPGRIGITDAVRSSDKSHSRA